MLNFMRRQHSRLKWVLVVVIVILGVGRIDGDEGDEPPVLAAGKAGGLRRRRFRQHIAVEGIGDAMGVDRDQAHRALAGK